MQIIVPESSIDPTDEDYYFDILDYVADHVEYLTRVSGIPKSSIPRYALAAESLEYYIGEVRNGEHSQFLGNANTNAINILDDVVYLSKFADLSEFQAIVEQAKAWVENNQHKASLQTGFEPNIDGKLKAIDNKLDELYCRKSPVADIVKMIRSQPELTVVEKTTREDLEVLWKDAAAKFLSTTTDSQVAIAKQLYGQICDWLMDSKNTALGIAAGQGTNQSKKNNVRFVDASFFGMEKIKHGMVYLATDTTDINKQAEALALEAYFIRINESGLTLRPVLTNPFTGKVPFPASVFLLIRKAKKKYIGRSIHVPLETINRVQEMLSEFRVAEAIALGWQRAGIPFSPLFYNILEIACKETGGVRLIVTMGVWQVQANTEGVTFASTETDDAKHFSKEQLATFAGQA